MNVKVSAVVVTYNRLELLKECISSLLNQEYDLSHIIIVNNNSTDNTENYLKRYINDDRIIVKNLNSNLGGAGGFNRGLKVAYDETDDDLFWIMDDDTIPNSCALKELIKKAEYLKFDFGYLCSNVKWIDGTSSNIPKVSSYWPELAENGLIEVTEATFVSILTSRYMVELVGYPITDIFIWGDDTEYTLRLSSKKKSFLVISSLVLHKSKQKTSNLTIVTDNSARLPRYFYLIRNVFYIRRKYYKDSVLKLSIKHLLLLFRIIKNSDKYKFKRVKILFKGYFAGLKFKPLIERVNKNEN